MNSFEPSFFYRFVFSTFEWILTLLIVLESVKMKNVVKRESHSRVEYTSLISNLLFTVNHISISYYSQHHLYQSGLVRLVHAHHQIHLSGLDKLQFEKNVNHILNSKLWNWKKSFFLMLTYQNKNDGSLLET